jgi:SAM-dependent methyltransferase
MKITLDTKIIESISHLLGNISADSELEFRVGTLNFGKFSSGVNKNKFNKLYHEIKKDSELRGIKREVSLVSYYNSSDIRMIEQDGKTFYQYKRRERNIDISFSVIDVRLSNSIERIVDSVEIGRELVSTRQREKNIFSFDSFDIELTKVFMNKSSRDNAQDNETLEVEIEFTRKISEIKDLVVPLRKIFQILFPDRFYMIPLTDEKEIRRKRSLISTRINPNPRNIKRKDISEMKNYSVTNKLNGVGYEMFLSDKGIHILNKTNIDKLTSKDIGLNGTVIEGEWWKGGFYIFNCLAWKGQDISSLPHRNRLVEVGKIINLLKETLVDICPVEQKLFLSSGNLALDTREIMRYMYNKFGDTALENNDGIMFQPQIGTPLKFKFPSLMTIDFEITNEKKTEKGKTYTIRVYNKQNNLIVFDGKNNGFSSGVSALIINPVLMVKKDHPLFDELSNGLIVECLFDKDNNNFIPERIRWDKKLPNFIDVAFDVYRDIIHPLRLEELVETFEKSNRSTERYTSTTPWRIYYNFGVKGRKIFNPPHIENEGKFDTSFTSEKDADETIRSLTLPVLNSVKWIEYDGHKIFIVVGKEGVKYFEQKKMNEKIEKPGECLVQMRKFHNKKKEQIIKEFVGVGNDVLDLGFGRGGDLLKYSNVGVNKIFGVDPNKDNLDEAMRRYADKKNNYNVDVEFINCRAQDTSFINEKMDYKKVDVVASFFSLTFFFENEEELNSLINTIAGNTKIGGYFIGTTMSGDKAYEEFRGLSTIEYKNCYKIDKLYEDDDKVTFGKKVVIHLEDTIVNRQEEYLVFFDLFVQKMAKRGFSLVQKESFVPLDNLDPRTARLSRLNISFAFKREETSEEKRVKERALEEKRRIKQERDNSLPMLEMDKNVAFRVSYINKHLVRTGTVGDGSCFFHSVLKCISPDYSKLDKQERKEFVGRLRDKMANDLSQEKWESFGKGTLAFSRLIPRFVRYIEKNVVDIFEKAKELEIKGSNTVEEYITLLLESIPEKTHKRVLNIFKQLRNRVFEEFKKDLTNCSTWVGEEMGSVDVFEYISDYFNIDIYLLRDTTRAPYRQGVDCNIRYKDRNSILVLWVGDSHYEAIGDLKKVDGKNHIQRVFNFNDEIIKGTKAIVCQE